MKAVAISWLSVAGALRCTGNRKLATDNSRSGWAKADRSGGRSGRSRIARSTDRQARRDDRDRAGRDDPESPFSGGDPDPLQRGECRVMQRGAYVTVRDEREIAHERGRTGAQQHRAQSSWKQGHEGAREHQQNSESPALAGR